MEPLTRDDEGVQDSFQAIGADLSAARLELGMQVSEVAQLLRISRNYIKSIEAGDFEQLPGPTYVGGYLRSYARAVGLDQDALPKRYRALIDDKAAQPQYAFPIDHQRPQRSGAMMASILVIFAVAGYGGWYAAGKPDLLNALTGDNAPSVISAPTVETAVIEPDDLVAPELQQTSILSEAEPVSTAVAIGGVSDRVDAGFIEDVDGSSDGTAIQPDLATAGTVADAAGLVSEGSAPADGGVGPSPIQSVDSTSGAGGTNALLAQSSADDGLLTGEDGDQAPASALNPLATNSDLTTVAETGLASLPDGDAVAEESAGMPLGSGDAAASTGVAFAMQRMPELEITVRATGTSWVEIIRNNGEEVMTQLMRKGETYVVDSRDKLYLSTGNAGGLELLFHDGTVRSVGVSGEILRDLPLDAERLRNQL